MQVSVENTGPLERKVRVEVPEDKIATEVQSRLQSISRTSKIQGFRPGKAPIKVVEKHYGSRVRQEVIGEVVQSTFYEALAQEKLRPASRPTIDPMDAEQGQGLKYTATFEIFPEITLAPVEELKIEKPVCHVSDKDVENMIEIIRKQHKTSKPVERPSQEGDVLVIDFEGSMEGDKFEGGSGTDFRIELGSGRLIAGFEEGLTGKKAGEKTTLELSFPAEYPKEELAGKPVKFEITVKTVNEPVLPELNAELFASMGVKEGGLEAFKAEIRRNMEREVEQAVLARSKNKVLDALFAANKIDVPKSLIQQEAQQLNKQFHMSLQMRGIDVDHHHDEEAETAAFASQAEKKVSLQLIIADIVRTQQIKVEPAKVRQMIETVAQGYEDPAEVMKWYYADQNRLAEVEALALEDEVVAWILSKAKATEKEMLFDDLMNKGQTESI
jgi:trigger factor